MLFKYVWLFWAPDIKVLQQTEELVKFSLLL